MSAIFGIIDKKQTALDPIALKKMGEAMQHRAKTGIGTWHEMNVGLGCCRSIISFNNKGEVLPYRQGDLSITANVQLNNRAELLNKLGIDKKDEMPDAALVLYAFGKWEKDCVHHLEGEYVFAIWDGKEKELFIASDHIGFKCLYYYDSAEYFFFSSEIKAIEAVSPGNNCIDEYVLIKKIVRENCPVDTYNKDIKRLSGGNAISVKDGRFSLKRYWEFKKANKYSFLKDEDWYECLRSLVFQSIENKINVTDEIGVTLSGGLDSTAIACVLANLLQKKNKALYAFSSVSCKANQHIPDEKKYIRMVVDHCPNIISHLESADDITPLDNIDKQLLVSEDYAHNTLFMLIRLMEVAQSKNVAVMFTGFGGDQWVSSKGNGVIFELLKRGNIQQARKLIKEIAGYRNRSLSGVCKAEIISRLWIAKVYRHLKYEDSPMRFSYAKPSIKKKYQSPIIENSPLNQYDYINKGSISHSLQSYDQVTAYHGILGATPFLDKQVLEFMTDVPLHLYLKGGYSRSFFRNAFNGMIPYEIQWRFSKTGFAPDHSQRLLTRRNEVNDILNYRNNPEFFEKYLSAELLQEKVDKAFETIADNGRMPGMLSLCNLLLIIKSYETLKKNSSYFLCY